MSKNMPVSAGTFEQWWDSNPFRSQDQRLKELVRAAWNAALSSRPSSEHSCPKHGAEVECAGCRLCMLALVAENLEYEAALRRIVGLRLDQYELRDAIKEAREILSHTDPATGLPSHSSDEYKG